MVSLPDLHGLNAADQALANHLVAELEAEVSEATLDDSGVSALLDEKRFRGCRRGWECEGPR
jgi:hypothetical protein